ncbi:MAG TPA: sigma 54-interacting transcriptional regulator [Pyrinomonadaceae bacterium]|nr:sigma 54-interacting transcriptional regulator [Pyrinomonadaceae bacterium]
MLAVCDLVERVSKTNVTVLIEGESGTGKELIAKGYTFPVRGAKTLSSRSTVPQYLKH